MPAKKAFGTVVKVTIATVLTPIPNVLNITPFSYKSNIVDASSHDSPNEYKEKLSGFRDAGQCKVDINFDNTNAVHQFLITNIGVVIPMVIVFPGSTTPNTLTFSGIVADITGALPHDNKSSASITIEITGAPVWS